ncbi:uncharacterized protein LOC133136229 [Conger conger]|uniref:uncharacterized protein LOC133136229 n=1 Tax=Conger conger TaxID=82655 RepID=UPI002A5AD2CB|nr:uncharacterized protein LOC133136229 [Conger conger]
MDSKLVYAVALVIGCWVLAAKGLKINSTHTVGALTTTISRDGCGQTKTCLETPVNCDPSSNSTCLFVAPSVPISRDDDGWSFASLIPKFRKEHKAGWSFNTDIEFELRGDSENYIVLLLSSDNNLGTGDSGVVCAQYQNMSRFFTVTYNNGSLTVVDFEGVNNVLASLNRNVIQCTFTLLANSTGRPANFYVFAGNGMFSNGVLGDPEITLMRNSSVDLTNVPSQNIPVGALNAAITRDTCGRTKLCEEVPADCDPSGNGDCLFVSAATATTNRPSGINIAFELRGNTSGYVVLILSPDMIQGGGDESFVCAQFNNTLRFFTASFDNGALTMTNRTGAVGNALASLNGTVIRCTFTALGLNATARRSPDSSFYVFAGTGEYDGVSLGDPVIRLSSNGSLDLTNSTSNLPGGNGGAGLHPTSLVLLVLLSALISRLV